MNLSEKHAALRGALEPLGIDVGPEVLNVWADRAERGVDPLPRSALVRLMDVVELLVPAKR